MLGVGILGTKVCFSHPQKKSGTHPFTRHIKWYDLYDSTFVKDINKLASMYNNVNQLECANVFISL